MAGEVSRGGTIWVGQEDISQIPLIGQMTMSDGDADGQDLSHRLRVDDEVVSVRVRRRVARSRLSEQVSIVFLFLQSTIQLLRRRPASRACTTVNASRLDQWLRGVVVKALDLLSTGPYTPGRSTVGHRPSPNR